MSGEPKWRLPEPVTAKGKWLVYGDDTTVDEVLRYVSVIEAEARAAVLREVAAAVEAEDSACISRPGFHHFHEPCYKAHTLDIIRRLEADDA